MPTKFSQSLNKTTGHGSIPNFIQIDLRNLQEKKCVCFCSLRTVILTDGQGHLNRYQTIQSNAVCHHTMFERNPSINVRLPPDVLCPNSMSDVINLGEGGGEGMKSPKLGSLPWILIRWAYLSMRFIRPSFNSKPNLIEILWKLLEVYGAEVLAFSHHSDLEWRWRSPRLIWKCRV